MKHVIIGTAGHVDHGKTLLVKALTGIDTDRLQEEKKRGITIELGFAHLDFPDGTQAGIVDVPGHEKFIKNMLAGAGGVDICMLVVAADEGFMPQTVEHMDILTLLGIKDGCVVITKKDMVEPEWLEMMQEEIDERVQGTFLQGKPVIAVSAYTGEGIPELRAMLHDMIHKAEEKSARVPFRLPVDRVFSVEGFGTVVTGTLIEGCMNEGEAAALVPSGVDTRIRNLQVHGKDVTTAYAGQRVAVNLAGVKKTDIKRGDIVARPDTVRISRMLDVRLRNLKDSGRVIENDSQVHLYHGSAVLLAKVILLDRDALAPGESCYAQLRMTENIAAKNGDRFVIRFYSPLETIGGGVILDAMPERHKRNQPKVLESLKIKESGSLGDRILQGITELGLALPTKTAIASHVSMDMFELEPEMDTLVGTGRAIEVLPGRFVSSPVVDRVWTSASDIIAAYHKANPLHAGIKAAELRQKLFKSVDQTSADAVLGELCLEGRLKKVNETYALSDFEIKFTKKQNNIRTSLLKTYRDAGLEVPSVDEVMAGYTPAEKTDFKQVMESLVSSGDLVLFSPQLCVSRSVYDEILAALMAHFENSETITLADFRDMLNTSRKYALAALEYFDRIKLTKKEGDERRLIPRKA